MNLNEEGRGGKRLIGRKLKCRYVMKEEEWLSGVDGYILR
jgi:hypothetical protein